MSTPIRIRFDISFEEAIAFAKSRGIVLPDIFYGLLQGVARAEAFSIAGIAKLDQLDLVLKSLVKVLESGATFDTWRTKLLDSPDVLKLPKHRLDLIFRTVIQGAYGRGRCIQQHRNSESRPYLMYDAINDSRTRPAHAAMDGYIAKVADPVWKAWMPPPRVPRH